MIIKTDNLKVLQYFITFNQLPSSMSQKMFSSRLPILMKINILGNFKIIIKLERKISKITQYLLLTDV